MQLPEDEQQSQGAGTGKQPYVDPHFQPDHPGKQDISKNPDPRANENLPETGDEPVAKGDDTSNQAGSEITDGEAG